MALYEVTFVARIPQQSTAPQLVELGQLKHTAVSWTDDLTGVGGLDVGAKIPSLAPEIKARLLELNRTPNELWLHRDGVRVFAGPITSYQIQKQAISMHAGGLLTYLLYMVRDTPFSTVGEDQALIARDLIDAYQALNYGNFGLDASGLTTTGIARDLTLLGTENRTLDSVIREMGNRDNGFDLSCDPTSRKLMMYTPQRGQDLTAVRIMDRRNLIDAQVMISVAPGIFAPRIVATSTDPNGASLTGSVVDSAAEARFGRVMMSQSYANISEQTTLNDHLAKSLTTMATPAFVVTPELVPIADLDVGDVNPGDTVLYDFDVGLGAQSLARRVKSITTTVQKSKEKIGVTFL